jgi:hypothetical protein
MTVNGQFSSFTITNISYSKIPKFILKIEKIGVYKKHIGRPVSVLTNLEEE